MDASGDEDATYRQKIQRLDLKRPAWLLTASVQVEEGRGRRPHSETDLAVYPMALRLTTLQNRLKG